MFVSTMIGMLIFTPFSPYNKSAAEDGKHQVKNRETLYKCNEQFLPLPLSITESSAVYVSKWVYKWAKVNYKQIVSTTLYAIPSTKSSS